MPETCSAVRARSRFRSPDRRQNFFESSSERLGPRQSRAALRAADSSDSIAVLEVGREHADLERLDDIFAEILQPLDLQRLLLERLIEPRVLDRNRQVTGDRRKQFQVVAREVIAVDRLSQAQQRHRAVAEAAGDEIVQAELFERAAGPLGVSRSPPCRLEEQARRVRRPAAWDRESSRSSGLFASQPHRPRQHESPGSRRLPEKPPAGPPADVCEMRSSAEPSSGSSRTSLVSARPNSISVRR